MGVGDWLGHVEIGDGGCGLGLPDGEGLGLGLGGFLQAVRMHRFKAET
jgi:hypothetical protein